MVGMKVMRKKNELMPGWWLVVLEEWNGALVIVNNCYSITRRRGGAGRSDDVLIEVLSN